jgi:hypothetical protein
MDALRRSSGFLFHTLGIIAIVGILLMNRGMYLGIVQPLLAVLDLPLLFVGILFAGSSFLVSMSRGSVPKALFAIVFVPLTLVFLFFLYVNFAMPFAEVF